MTWWRNDNNMYIELDFEWDIWSFYSENKKVRKSMRKKRKLRTIVVYDFEHIDCNHELFIDLPLYL